MSGTSQAQALCPRCYAELAPGARSCGRCGVALDDSLPGRKVAHAPFCPRCDRVEADGAGFTGLVGHGAAGSCEHCGTMLVEAPADRRAASNAGPIAYEEVSRATASWDLDRLIRAEAVDGWTLVDTTVDPSAPDRLLAHFRRALRAEAPSTEVKAQAKAARLADREAKKTRRENRRAQQRDRLGPILNRKHPWEWQLIELTLSVGVALIREVAIPIVLGLLHAFLGPSLRRSQHPGSRSGRR